MGQVRGHDGEQEDADTQATTADDRDQNGRKPHLSDCCFRDVDNTTGELDRHILLLRLLQMWERNSVVAVVVDIEVQRPTDDAAFPVPQLRYDRYQITTRLKVTSDSSPHIGTCWRILELFPPMANAISRYTTRRRQEVHALQ